jgi:hypothetical protein
LLLLALDALQRGLDGFFRCFLEVALAEPAKVVRRIEQASK